jgi:hypothetical protein
MNTRLSILVSALVLMPVTGFATEWTIVQPITLVQYDGVTDNSYFAGALKWGAASCATVTYVSIAPSVPGRKQLLSLALAAQLSGRTVRFLGQCQSNGYFEATYISVES